MDFDELSGLEPGKDYPRWLPIIGGDEDGVFFDLPGLPKWSPWKEGKKKGASGSYYSGRSGLGELGAVEAEAALGGFFKVAAGVGVVLLLVNLCSKKKRRRR